MKSQYVDSITLDELIRKLIEYKETNPEKKEKMVYFDCIHIKGELYDNGNVLELL